MSQTLPEPIQFGKYTLYERIGRGGMADVFKGRIQGPAGFERVFVVKRILPHLSDDPAFIKMFVEEAKMSARLNHPNIVQIFELGSVEGEYFISMEHVSGHDLAETMRALWKASGPPRPDLVAYIGREICRALAYAHSLTDERGQPLGMIHRDVSPSNVMLSFEGAVKLLDFGIAKALGDTPETTKSGTLKGKYAYMAPEQTESEDVDARIDIFAAGIVLHEVLTGRRLFKGANDIQTIERVRRCEVRPPSQTNAACPPELDAILLKALARNRDERFQTASDMADALDDVVHAYHFTPQHMGAILRETFGIEGGAAPPPERRLTSSGISTVPTTASGARSGTVPPVTRTTGTGSMPVDPNALSAIKPRPVWRRGGFWAVATICAAGLGIAVAKGVGTRTDAGPGDATNAPAANLATRAAPPKKVKLVPVLVQSDPEGAEIFVAGKLESVGATPMWLNLELDKNSPARVMLRKGGFQDKAIAIEVEKPDVVHLIPINARPSPGSPSGAPATTAADTASDADKAALKGARHHGPGTVKKATKGKPELVEPSAEPL